ARTHIESAVRAYLTLQERGSALTPAKIKEKLQKLRSQAKKLLEGFEEALGHDDIYFALVRVGRNEWHPRNFEQRTKLAEHHRTEKVRADLAALIDWLDQSGALPRRNPGPSAEHAENVFLFVESIDGTLDYYTNERHTLSKRHRDMMGKIFRVLDREVGSGT